jgi:hypothetical protein
MILVGVGLMTMGADYDYLHNLILTPYNPTIRFGGQITFIDMDGNTVATISDKGLAMVKGVVTQTTKAPTMTGVALVPAGTEPQAFGTDLVIARSPKTVLPMGPSIDGVTLRVRTGTKYGTYKLVVIGGSQFNKEVTIVDNIPAMGAPTLGP